MTERLFDTDSHLLEFEARVLSSERVKDGFLVCLDATAFAPEGGGQPSDIGYLDEATVLDVKENGEDILHLVDSPLSVGDRVCGRVDRERRLRHLQNHTGEHIVTGLFYREYGMNNIGFHLGHEDVTLDLDGSVDLPMLRRIEKLANLAVAENRAVRVLYPSREELASLFYRSKGEIEGRVRLVEIEGLDRCACCVPHVKATGEVGGIKLLGVMRYKGGSRIRMKCGMDAIAHACSQADRESALSQLLSLPPERLVEGVKKLAEDLAVAKYRLVQMKQERIRTFVDGLDGSEGRFCVFEKDLDVSELRMLAGGVVEKTGRFCVAFSGDDERGYCFVIADPISFEETVASFRAAFSPKGGGKPPILQGTVDATESELRAFFEMACFQGGFKF